MHGFALTGAARSAGLKRTESRLLRAGFAVLVGIIALSAANALLGVGGVWLRLFIREWLSCVVYILAAAIVLLRALRGCSQRRSWALFAAGLSLYGVGNVLWSVWIGNLKAPPIPSVSDGLWLTLYPLSYAGIVGFARLHEQRRLPAGVWLDGIIAGGGLAALGAAIVFGPVLAGATGSKLAVATELAYPIGDLLLAALVVGVLALRGWRMTARGACSGAASSCWRSPTACMRLRSPAARASRAPSQTSSTCSPSPCSHSRRGSRSPLAGLSGSTAGR